MAYLPCHIRTECPPPPVPLAKQKKDLGEATMTPPTQVDGPPSARSMPTPAGSNGLNNKLNSGEIYPNNLYQGPYLLVHLKSIILKMHLYFLYNKIDLILYMHIDTCTCANSKLPCRSNHHGTWGFPATMCM